MSEPDKHEMNKAPVDVIAENLPLYQETPTLGRRTKDAAAIMSALTTAGYEILRTSPEHRVCDYCKESHDPRIACQAYVDRLKPL